MRVSLVVATLGRVEPLRRLFASLAAQSHRDFEVLLADQNPPGYLDAVLDEFTDLPIAVNPTPPRGVSAARNAVLPQADGDIIAFPDDDCFYEPDTLAQVVHFFADHPEYDGVLAHWMHPGACLPPSIELASTTVPVRRTSAFVRGETHVQFYRHGAVRRWGALTKSSDQAPACPGDAVRTQTIFCEVLEAEFLVARCDAIHTRHPAPDMTDPSLVSKMHSYGLGRMHVLRKHRFPLWFRLANVVYPLAHLPLDLSHYGWAAVRYRLAMFQGRCVGLWLRGGEDDS